MKAVRSVPVVGKYTAKLIKWLEYKQAISLSALHVIGFSLGSHVGAFIGEELARNRSEKVKNIFNNLQLTLLYIIYFINQFYNNANNINRLEG